MYIYTCATHLLLFYLHQRGILHTVPVLPHSHLELASFLFLFSFVPLPNSPILGVGTTARHDGKWARHFTTGCISAYRNLRCSSSTPCWLFVHVCAAKSHIMPQHTYLQMLRCQFEFPVCERSQVLCTPCSRESCKSSFFFFFASATTKSNNWSE